MTKRQPPIVELTEQTKEGAQVWDNLEDEARRAELSHWRGAGKFADDELWLGIGRRSKKNLDNAVRFRRDRAFWAEKKVMLEWGQGGGANAFAFRDLAEAYYGVDISTKNLEETSRVCSADGMDYFRPIYVEEDPNVVGKNIVAPVQVFLSTAVFQHFPSKEYGAEVLKVLYETTSTDAVGIIQIRYNDGSAKFSGNKSIDEYRKNFIIATTYGIDEFWNLCTKIGFKVLYTVDLNPRVNYLTFALSK